jgi:mono/diheme cytochrome c family protein
MQTRLQLLPVRIFRRAVTTSVAVGLISAAALLDACASTGADRSTEQTAAGTVVDSTGDPVTNGQRIFRFDTFGNEQFWTDTLRLHEVVEKSVDPTTALKVGLKVDADVLPPGILQTVDLKSPATTVALLKMNAIVGIQATVDSNNHITRLGVTCALCHSTVDNSVQAGIGRRMDGWPNVDLNVGAIIALSPAVTAAQKAVYTSWGPGMYDPRYNIDGKNTPLVLPPAYGLANIQNETYTAEGPISYWNAYVAVTQMHSHGSFTDSALNIYIVQTPDMVTSRLPALKAYQHSLAAPPAPAGNSDTAASNRGQAIFNASCVSCHVGVNGTDNNNGKLHAASETGMDSAYALRTKTRMYRTTPLRALWQHPPYFHDGSAKTLADVVAHYNRVLKLNLTAAQQRDLVQYLNTI